MCLGNILTSTAYPHGNETPTFPLNEGDEVELI